MARQYVWLFQNHLPINLWRPSRHVSRIYTSWLGSTVRWLLLHGHLQVRLWNFFGERFQIFLSPCVNPRPIRFTRENETEVEGVKGTRFVLNATDTFGLFFIFSLFCDHLVGKNQLLLFIGNASTNPDNWCYNANLPYGVHNSTGCKGGDTTLKWVRVIIDQCWYKWAIIYNPQVKKPYGRSPIDALQRSHTKIISWNL